MKRTFNLAAVLVLVLGAMQARGQSVTFDFQDGTDQGFGTGFGNDASASFSIVDIGGSLRMYVPRNAFQVAGVAHGSDGSAFYTAMSAAAGNESGYTISYDWYVDTAAFGAGAGSFFQLGTYVNTGSGYYFQNFGTPKEVELNGTQLASGQVVSGHVSINMAAVGFDMPAADTFFRMGLIENGDGAAQGVYFDNISISQVPEPSSLALLGLAVPAWWMIHRRRSTIR